MLGATEQVKHLAAAASAFIGESVSGEADAGQLTLMMLSQPPLVGAEDKKKEEAVAALEELPA